MSSLAVDLLLCVCREILCNDIYCVTVGTTVPLLLRRQCLVILKHGVTLEGEVGSWVSQAL
jgi:hypothetical protein